MTHLFPAFMTVLADVSPMPYVGNKEQSIIAVLLIGGALALIGYRLYKKKN